VAEGIDQPFHQVREILEPTLLAAKAAARGKSDRSSLAAQLFRLARESFWDHVAPDVNQFVEGLPYLCAWIGFEMGCHPMYSVRRLREWALRNNVKSAKAQKASRGRPPALIEVNGAEYKEMRGERSQPELSKHFLRHRKKVSVGIIQQAETKNLATPKTIAAYGFLKKHNPQTCTLCIAPPSGRQPKIPTGKNRKN
jgi:hypothetical protein